LLDSELAHRSKAVVVGTVVDVRSPSGGRRPIATLRVKEVLKGKVEADRFSIEVASRYRSLSRSRRGVDLGGTYIVFLAGSATRLKLVCWFDAIWVADTDSLRRARNLVETDRKLEELFKRVETGIVVHTKRVAQDGAPEFTAHIKNGNTEELSFKLEMLNGWGRLRLAGWTNLLVEHRFKGHTVDSWERGGTHSWKTTLFKLGPGQTASWRFKLRWHRPWDPPRPGEYRVRWTVGKAVTAPVTYYVVRDKRELEDNPLYKELAEDGWGLPFNGIALRLLPADDERDRGSLRGWLEMQRVMPDAAVPDTIDVEKLRLRKVNVKDYPGSVRLPRKPLSPKERYLRTGKDRVFFRRLVDLQREYRGFCVRVGEEYDISIKYVMEGKSWATGRGPVSRPLPMTPRCSETDAIAHYIAHLLSEEIWPHIRFLRSGMESGPLYPVDELVAIGTPALKQLESRSLVDKQESNIERLMYAIGHFGKQGVAALTRLATSGRELARECALRELKLLRQEDRPDADLGDLHPRGQPGEPRGAIQGKVLSAKAMDAAAGGKTVRRAWVVIDKGKEDGVLKGDSFLVYRSDEYVGRIEIDQVLDTMSIGKLVTKRLEVKPGDRVTSKVDFRTLITE